MFDAAAPGSHEPFIVGIVNPFTCEKDWSADRYALRETFDMHEYFSKFLPP